MSELSNSAQTQHYNVMPRYIAFGPGAIGSILGTALHRSGPNTVLVGQGSHVQAIRKDGLQLMSEGVLRRMKLSAIEDPSKQKRRGAIHAFLF